MTFRHEAIRELYTDVVYIDDAIGAFDKDNKKVTLDEDKIKTKISELETAYNKLEYQRQREQEYPPMQDQLDDIYHNGIDSWKSKIKTIKDKYPKG